MTDGKIPTEPSMARDRVCRLCSCNESCLFVRDVGFQLSLKSEVHSVTCQDSHIAQFRHSSGERPADKADDAILSRILYMYQCRTSLSGEQLCSRSSFALPVCISVTNPFFTELCIRCRPARSGISARNHRCAQQTQNAYETTRLIENG